MPKFNNKNCANEQMIRERVTEFRSLENEDLNIVFEQLSLDKVNAILAALSAKTTPISGIEFQFSANILENDPLIQAIATTLKALVDANNIDGDDEDSENSENIKIRIYYAQLSVKARNHIEALFTQYFIKYEILEHVTFVQKSSYLFDNDGDDAEDISSAEFNDGVTFDGDKSAGIENFSSLSIAKQLDAHFAGKKHARTARAQSVVKYYQAPAAAQSPKSTKLLGDKNELTSTATSSIPDKVDDYRVMPMDADKAAKADKSALLPSPAKEEKKQDTIRGKILKRRLFDMTTSDATPVSIESNGASQLSSSPSLSASQPFMITVPAHAHPEIPLQPADSSHEKLDKKSKIIVKLHALDSDRCLEYYSSRYTGATELKEKVMKKEGGYGNPDRIQKQYCDLYRLTAYYNFPLLNVVPIDKSVLVAQKENVYPETEYYFLGNQVHIKGMGMLYDPFMVNKPDTISILIANDLFRRIRAGINIIREDKNFKRLDSSNISIKRLVCSTGATVDNIVIIAPSGHTDGSDTSACTEIKEKFWHILAEIVAQMNEDIVRYPNITFLFQTYYNNLSSLNPETLEVMRIGDYSSCQVNKSLQIMILRAIDASLRKRQPSYNDAFSNPEEQIWDKGCSEMKTLSLELKLRAIYNKVEIVGVENASLTSLLKKSDLDRHSREYTARLPCINCMRTIPAYNVLVNMHEVLNLPSHARQPYLAARTQSTLFLPEKKADGFFARYMLERADSDSVSPPVPPLIVPAAPDGTVMTKKMN